MPWHHQHGRSNDHPLPLPDDAERTRDSTCPFPRSFRFPSVGASTSVPGLGLVACISLTSTTSETTRVVHAATLRITNETTGSRRAPSPCRRPPGPDSRPPRPLPGNRSSPLRSSARTLAPRARSSPCSDRRPHRSAGEQKGADQVDRRFLLVDAGSWRPRRRRRSRSARSARSPSWERRSCHRARRAGRSSGTPRPQIWLRSTVMMLRSFVVFPLRMTWTPPR